MSKFKDPFLSLIVFSIYSGIMGAVLLIIPKVILPIVKVDEEVNTWTYMMGFVLICSSFYYFMSGLNKNLAFARLTVYTRFSAPVIVAILYVAGNAPITFLFLSFVDASGGFWSLFCLRNYKSTSR